MALPGRLGRLLRASLEVPGEYDERTAGAKIAPKRQTLRLVVGAGRRKARDTFDEDVHMVLAF